MAALAEQTANTSTQNVEIQAQPCYLHDEHPVTGIANAIIYQGPLGFEVLALTGDRHHWTTPLKAEWAEHWYSAGVGASPLGSGASEPIKGPPHQVYTCEDKLIVTNKEFGPWEIAMAQIEHAINKGWVPKIVCDTREEAVKIATHKEFTISIKKLRAFHKLMREFTNKVKPLRYVEVVMGGRDKNEPVIDALMRETWEEAGMQLSREDAVFIGHSDPFTNRRGQTSVTAIFVTMVPIREDALALFDLCMHERRPTGCELACPHSYFKYLEGIDVLEADYEKSNLEVVWGTFCPIDLDLPALAKMDSKNIKIMDKVAEHLRGLDTIADVDSSEDEEFPDTPKYVPIGEQLQDMKEKLTAGEKWKGRDASWWAEMLKNVFTAGLIKEVTGIANVDSADKTPEKKRKAEAVAPGAPKKPKSPTSP